MESIPLYQLVVRGCFHRNASAHGTIWETTDDSSDAFRGFPWSRFSWGVVGDGTNGHTRGNVQISHPERGLEAEPARLERVGLRAYGPGCLHPNPKQASKIERERERERERKSNMTSHGRQADRHNFTTSPRRRPAHHQLGGDGGCSANDSSPGKA